MDSAQQLHDPLMLLAPILHGAHDVTELTLHSNLIYQHVVELTLKCMDKDLTIHWTRVRISIRADVLLSHISASTLLRWVDHDVWTFHCGRRCIFRMGLHSVR